jgi:hypothetical protein
MIKCGIHDDDHIFFQLGTVIPPGRYEASTSAALIRATEANRSGGRRSPPAGLFSRWHRVEHRAEADRLAHASAWLRRRGSLRVTCFIGNGVASSALLHSIRGRRERNRAFSSPRDTSSRAVMHVNISSGWRSNRTVILLNQQVSIRARHQLSLRRNLSISSRCSAM